MTPWVWVGVVENRRAVFFAEACREAGLPAPIQLSWLEVLEEPDRLGRVCGLDRLLKLDAAGECAAVERALLALGAGEVEAPVGPEDVAPGVLVAPEQSFAGFRRLLEVVAAVVPAGQPMLRTPEEILRVHHKPTCHAVLRAAGVPVPAALPAVASVAELRAAMTTPGWSRVFVKLAASSSAAGVVALAAQGARVRAVTPAAREGAWLVNHLRPRVYTDWAAVEAVLEPILAAGAHIEAWYPKVVWRGRRCDLRVVVIDGEARHMVLRTSRTPLTNLHLGNRRGDTAGFLAALGPEGERAVREVAEAAAAACGGLLAGVDVAVDRDGRPVVLEVNAFGDLLPGVLDRGESTYRAQVEAARRYVPSPS